MIFQTHFYHRILRKKCSLWLNTLPQPTHHHCKTRAFANPELSPSPYALTTLIYWSQTESTGVCQLQRLEGSPLETLSYHYIWDFLFPGFPRVTIANKYKSNQAWKDKRNYCILLPCLYMTAKLLEDKGVTWFPQHLTFSEAFLSVLHYSRSWRFSGDQRNKKQQKQKMYSSVKMKNNQTIG